MMSFTRRAVASATSCECFLALVRGKTKQSTTKKCTRICQNSIVFISKTTNAGGTLLGDSCKFSVSPACSLDSTFFRFAHTVSLLRLDTKLYCRWLRRACTGCRRTSSTLAADRSDAQTAFSEPACVRVSITHLSNARTHLYQPFSQGCHYQESFMIAIYSNAVGRGDALVRRRSSGGGAGGKIAQTTCKNTLHQRRRWGYGFLHNVRQNGSY